MYKAIGAGTATQNQLNSNYYIQVQHKSVQTDNLQKGGPDPSCPGKDVQGRNRGQGVGSISTGEGKDNPDRFQSLLVSDGAYQKNIPEQKGVELPKAVHPDHPLNYMGTFKIHLSHATSQGSIYRIHGNNNKKRIGKRVTGGCICMDNAEGEELAKMVPVGTEVNIVL